MDNAYKTLKKIVLILIFIYFVSFLFYSDFLTNLARTKPSFDFSRYLYRILNLK